jgi:hypothetical protein
LDSFHLGLDWLTECILRSSQYQSQSLKKVNLDPKYKIQFPLTILNIMCEDWVHFRVHILKSSSHLFQGVHPYVIKPLISGRGCPQ